MYTRFDLVGLDHDCLNDVEPVCCAVFSDFDERVNHLLLLFVLDKERLQSHRDFDQVVLDVNRSLKRFPPGLQSNYSLVDYPNLNVSGRPK